MDGPTIQEASSVALAHGANPPNILDDLRRFDSPVPIVVMTYYNLVFRAGLRALRVGAGRVRGGGRGPARRAARGAGPVGRGRTTRRHRHGAAGRPGHARRPPHPGVRGLAGLRVRREPHGGDRGAGLAGGAVGHPGPAAQGGHRPAGDHGLRRRHARGGGRGGGTGRRRDRGLGDHAPRARRRLRRGGGPLRGRACAPPSTPDLRSVAKLSLSGRDIVRLAHRIRPENFDRFRRSRS